MVSVDAEGVCDTCESSIKNNFESSFGDSVISKSDVNGSMFLAGSNVELNTIVDGVSLLAGANNTISGITEYLVSASSTVNLTGTVNKDMVIFSSDVNINETFVLNRDGLILGSNITVSGKFLRDIIIMGSNVNLDNVLIEGNVKIYADTINVSDTTIINGRLSYNEDTLITNNSDNINEIEILEIIEIEEESQFKYNLSMFLYSLVRIFGTALFMVIILPSLFKKLDKNNERIEFNNIFKHLGFGALVLVFLPLAALILLLSSLGFSVGLILIPIYIIMIYISTIFSGYLIGRFLKVNVIKKELNSVLYLLMGIFIICLLKVIPFVGDLVGILSLLIGLGMIIDLFLKQER